MDEVCPEPDRQAGEGHADRPVTILCWSFPREDVSREQSALQIGLGIRDEVADLEAAGIKIIQIDEPAIREGLPCASRITRPIWTGRCAFRLSASPVVDSTQIHTHMCYSDFNLIIEAVAALDADVITIETSRSQMQLLEAFGALQLPQRDRSASTTSTRRTYRARAGLKTIRKAAQQIPADRLWVNPDCGLKTRGLGRDHRCPEGDGRCDSGAARRAGLRASFTRRAPGECHKTREEATAFLFLYGCPLIFCRFSQRGSGRAGVRAGSGLGKPTSSPGEGALASASVSHCWSRGMALRSNAITRLRCWRPGTRSGPPSGSVWVKEAKTGHTAGGSQGTGTGVGADEEERPPVKRASLPCCQGKRHVPEQVLGGRRDPRAGSAGHPGSDGADPPKQPLPLGLESPLMVGPAGAGEKTDQGRPGWACRSAPGRAWPCNRLPRGWVGLIARYAEQLQGLVGVVALTVRSLRTREDEIPMAIVEAAFLTACTQRRGDEVIRTGGEGT